MAHDRMMRFVAGVVMSVAACSGSHPAGGDATNDAPADSAPDAAPPVLQGLFTYVKASNTDAGDRFGWHVAISGDGNTIAVGAPGESSHAKGVGGEQGDNSLSQAGAVYIYVRSGGSWIQQAYVKASNTDVGGQFGSKVALSDDGGTLAVTEADDESCATGVDGDPQDRNCGAAGAVFVFTRSGTTWAQQAYVKASNTHGQQYFGVGLALSGDGSTLAVGAPGEASAATGIDGDQSDISRPSSGAVYVYTRSGTAWSQQAYVKASNTGGLDQFGISIALSGDGNVMAASAPSESSAASGVNGSQADDSKYEAGAAYVFGRTGTTWTQHAYIKASNPDRSDFFGFSVGLSAIGSTLVVGAPSEASAATGIDGDQSDNSELMAGAVYVFTESAGAWAQQAYVKAANSHNGPGFGYAVSVSADGDTIGAGALDEMFGGTGITTLNTGTVVPASGVAYVFRRSSGTWSQLDYIKASNTGMNDLFGCSLAMAASSGTLVVAAYNEDSAASGVGGNQADNAAQDSGAVYVIE